MKKTTLLLLLATALATGCSETESPKNTCDYDREYEEFLKKMTQWEDDMTTARCEEMRKSAISVLQKLRSCPGGVVTAEEAMESWRDVDCSAFDLYDL